MTNTCPITSQPPITVDRQAHHALSSTHGSFHNTLKAIKWLALIALGHLSGSMIRGVQGQNTPPLGYVGGPEFQVNTFTKGDQKDPSVAWMNNQQYVVTWTSVAQGGVKAGIFAQQFEVPNQHQFGERRMDGMVQHNQNFAKVSGYGIGGYAISYDSDGQIDRSNLGVIFRSFWDNGFNKTANTRVNQDTSNAQENSSLATLKNNSVVVVWQSWEGTTNRTDVFARLLTTRGKKLTDEFKVHDPSSSKEKNPDVAALSDGGFAVVWERESNPNKGRTVWVRYFYADGTKSDAVQLATNVKGPNEPSITALPNNRCMVVWRKVNSATDAHLNGRIIANDGTPEDVEFRAADATGPLHFTPDIATVNDDLVVLVSARNLSAKLNFRNQIFGKFLSANGTRLDKEFGITGYRNGTFANAKVAKVQDGFVVVWDSENEDGDQKGVFGRYFQDPSSLTTVKITNPNSKQTDQQISSTLDPSSVTQSSLKSSISSSDSSPPFLILPSYMITTQQEQTATKQRSLPTHSLSTLLTSSSNSLFTQEDQQLSPSSNSISVIAGIASAGALLCCSLLGGGFIFLRKRLPKEENNPEVPAQEPQTTPNHNEYQVIPSNPSSGRYNVWPEGPQPHTTEHYHKEGLEVLNQNMEEYLSARVDNNTTDTETHNSTT